MFYGLIAEPRAIYSIEKNPFNHKINFLLLVYAVYALKTALIAS